jgi:hypothetical protein
VGHADIMEVVGGPPPAHIKQICEGIVERGNIAYGGISNVTPYNMSNTFESGSKEWYITNSINDILANIVGPPFIRPSFPLYFLKYNGGNNITDVELSFDENTEISNNKLQKAIALLPSATHIAVPMKKLPPQIPKQWLSNLRSLTAPGLKHIRKGAFFYSFGLYRPLQIDLPSVASIGRDAFSDARRLAFVNLHDTLKFIGDVSFDINYMRRICIPDFTHFLGYTPFASSRLASYVSLSDLVTMLPFPFANSMAETLSITCYSRINNIKKMLTQMGSTYMPNIKNVNITFDDSINHTVNAQYVNTILAANSTAPYGEWDGLFAMVRATSNLVSLDLSNLTMSDDEIKNIDVIDDGIPWGIFFPHITTVDFDLNELFKKLKGVVLFDTKTVTKDAFAGCSGITKVLGFCDTTAFEAGSLSDLTPSELRIKVTQPKNLAPFLNALQRAGLIFSNISRFVIKFSNSIAQGTSIGGCVADLLAALPPPPKIPRIPGFLTLTALFTSIYEIAISPIFTTFQ